MSLRRKLLQPTSAFALVGVASAATLALAAELATDYAPKRTFEVTLTQSSSTELVSMEVFIDGEPMDRGGRGGGGASSSTLTLTTTDTILESEDGAPTKVRRTFDEVSSTTSAERGGETMESEGESAFEGITIELTQGDDDEVTVEVTDGDAPEEERLEGHSLALAIDGLLPEDSVDEGDEWTIEGADLLAALGHGISRKLIDRPEREGGDGEGRGRGGRGRGGRGGRGGGNALGMFAGAEWDVTAKMTGETEDVDGLECAVIEIEAEADGELEMGGRGEGRRRDRAAGQEGRGGRGGTQETTFSAKLEGKLLWNVEGKHPVSLSIEGSAELSTDMERETQRGVMEMSRVTEITLEASVEISAGSAEDK